MYATKHAVFVGPGRLTKELRDVLLRRQGAPQPDVAINAVRLLSFFDSAAEAERVAGQVQRLKINASVVGPEQPPAASAWRAAMVLDGARLTLAVDGQQLTLDPPKVTRLAVVDWRVDDRVDRAVLITTTERAIFLRATEQPSLATALREFTTLVDALTRQGVTLLHRKLTREDVGAPDLTGDLLPLALALVDTLDRPRPSVELTQTPTVPLSNRRTWALFSASSVAGLAAAPSSHPVLAVGAGALTLLCVLKLVRDR